MAPCACMHSLCAHSAKAPEAAKAHPRALRTSSRAAYLQTEEPNRREGCLDGSNAEHRRRRFHCTKEPFFVSGSAEC